MICIPITGPTLEQARVQLNKAIYYGDLVELRLDAFEDRSPNKVRELIRHYPKPIIFTLRSRAQGGSYSGSESERIIEIMRLALLKPAYFDLEYHLSEDLLKHFQIAFPTIKLIISYHDFINPHLDIEDILKKISKIKGAFYKIATIAFSSLDSLKMRMLSKKYPQGIFVSMGEHGVPSRILASHISYARLPMSEGSAPGQISATDLIEMYRYKSIDPKTQFFGLIGNPITKSIGHYCHNAVFNNLDLNAVYLKMHIETKELQECLSLSKELGFKGLSVTMPHKESIMNHIDHVDLEAKKIGAVNTLVIFRGEIYGYNTDGIGALDAIENKMSVYGKNIIILGAGGAARAIIFEAIKRGAHVHILNRSEEKAKQIADEFGCGYGALDKMKDFYFLGYDILINCTPNEQPIDSSFIAEKSLVMDIDINPRTKFLEEASQKGCKIVFGYEMFINQAFLQLQHWFGKDLDKEIILKILMSQIRR